MGFFQRLLHWLFGGEPPADAETVDDVADRLDAFGDRCRNAGDAVGLDAARSAARRAREARTVPIAQQIERDFLAAQDRPPAKPKAGRHGGGEQYVAYGQNARVGGSVGWRNNNPGYIRCTDRLSRYGATGCDGEYAIFPSEEAGRVALVQYLREEYPQHTVADALREQLPAEAGPRAAADVLEKAGLDPQQRVEELTMDQLETVADTFPDVAGWELGETYNSGSAAPDWVENLWDAPPATSEPASDSANDDS